MIRFFRYILTGMLLMIVALASAVTTMRFAIHGAEVPVPELIGVSLSDAIHKTAKAGLILNVEDRFYSNDVPQGQVISQAPKAGTVVRREWHVRVAESLGPQKITIPNVVGMDELSAVEELRKDGVELGSISTLPYALVNPGTVIAQDPPAATQGVDRPRVSLLLSSSPESNPN